MLSVSVVDIHLYHLFADVYIISYLYILMKYIWGEHECIILEGFLFYLGMDRTVHVRELTSIEHIEDSGRI